MFGIHPGFEVYGKLPPVAKEGVGLWLTRKPRDGLQACVHTCARSQEGGGAGRGGKVGDLSCMMKLLEIKQLCSQSCPPCSAACKPSAGLLAASSRSWVRFAVDTSCNNEEA